jgi:hypothetical protein
MTEYLDKQIEGVLADISSALLEREDVPLYSERALLSASIIFMNVMQSHQWALMEKEKMPMDHREKMAEQLGGELRKLVKTYTSIDLHKINIK